jgi:hypothetical protein
MRVFTPKNERGRLQAAGRSKTGMHLNHIDGDTRQQRRDKRRYRDLCIVMLTCADAMLVAMPEGWAGR